VIVPALATRLPPRVRVASYNVHRCIGRDGKADPARVAAVVCELGADIVALQEIDSPRRSFGGVDQLEHLARATNLEPIAGPTLLHYHGRFGNALLTRWTPDVVRQIDLGVPGRERRGALDVELARDTSGLRVVATHLGLRARERRTQIGALLAALRRGATPLTVLLGDFNHWTPAFRALREIDRELGRAAVLRTFPAWRPLLALDRVWVSPATALVEVHVHATPGARAASDHLPICATVRIDGSTTESS